MDFSTKVRIALAGNEEVEVDKEIAEMSVTLANMLES